jgi:hypothetical protein
VCRLMPTPRTFERLDGIIRANDRHQFLCLVPPAGNGTSGTHFSYSSWVALQGQCDWQGVVEALWRVG